MLVARRVLMLLYLLLSFDVSPERFYRLSFGTSYSAGEWMIYNYYI